VEKIYYVVDIDCCMGCKSCQTACNLEHGYAGGSGWPIEVFRMENLAKNGQATCDFIPVLCLHCETPDCVSACPEDALSKNEEGLVLVEESLCTACGKCVAACNYGAIYLRECGDGKKKATKCNLCGARRVRGFPPSCGHHCLGQVFRTCRESEKEQLLANYRYSWSRGQLVYVSNILSEIGKAL